MKFWCSLHKGTLHSPEHPAVWNQALPRIDAWYEVALYEIQEYWQEDVDNGGICNAIFHPESLIRFVWE